MKKPGILAGAVLALFLPTQAQAASIGSDSLVAGVGGSELAITVATPAAMTFTPSTDGAATSLVTVTSTAPAWTLSVLDQSATTPGKLDKVDCVTGASTGGGLANPLQWSTDGIAFNDLSGTAATVATGTLVDAKTVTYKQQVDPGDGVALAACYQLTATYTVTDS